eukprot:CAMPEP_0206604882 /NCGR_PEP_ID=MMETSP0325_2-20121206/49910_1 /ASSEMBLY_ACC=CAM_ASM_000347 /TAXON_ID=2866 /ORGANISM="Crypthecodinium cohnii, Strain Seligo" /LENGTH=105 /DNA_ID=CAMNT_0054119971 /DNA_START=175 /DNA_END=489 /DNA_ORIENTATION=-
MEGTSEGGEFARIIRKKKKHATVCVGVREKQGNFLGRGFDNATHFRSELQDCENGVWSCKLRPHEGNKQFVLASSWDLESMIMFEVLEAQSGSRKVNASRYSVKE